MEEKAANNSDGNIYKLLIFPLEGKKSKIWKKNMVLILVQNLHVPEKNTLLGITFILVWWRKNLLERRNEVLFFALGSFAVTIFPAWIPRAEKNTHSIFNWRKNMRKSCSGKMPENVGKCGKMRFYGNMRENAHSIIPLDRESWQIDSGSCTGPKTTGWGKIDKRHSSTTNKARKRSIRH